MSAFKRIECTAIVERDILLKALESLGLEYTEHATPQKLHGYTGDVREQQAEIIVTRQALNKQFTGGSNDLGASFNSDKGAYDLIVSDFDAAQKIPQRIKQAYAKCAIEKHLKLHKFANINVTGNISERKKTKVGIIASKII